MHGVDDENNVGRQSDGYQLFYWLYNDKWGKNARKHVTLLFGFGIAFTYIWNGIAMT